MIPPRIGLDVVVPAVDRLVRAIGCSRGLVAATILVAFALPCPAAAQTKADAFAGKIPPISGQLFRKAGRLELTAGGSLSLNDAFFRKVFGDLSLAYHATESWSLSVHASSGLLIRSGSAVVCSATEGCRDAKETELRQVPGRIRAISGLQLAWAPVYGKLNVLAEKVAHFDLSVLAGLDAIFHDEILAEADANRLAASGGDPKLVTTGGAHVGLGARLFLSESMALRLEVKDLVYLVKVPNNGSRNDLQNQLFTEIGFSVFFPTRNRPQR